MASRDPVPTSPQERVRSQSTFSGSVDGPQIIEATFLMTRERAMMLAGDLAHKLGHRGADQAALDTRMNKWLSVPVIKVLSEEMKNKVFIWCQHYNQGWLDTIRTADDDVVEYRYVTSVEESNALRMGPSDLDYNVGEKLEALGQEILEEQRQGMATLMAKMDSLGPSDQISVGASSTKRRRTSTQNHPKNATMETMRKVDEGLCYVVGENSELTQCFRELAVSVDPNFSDVQSKSSKEIPWTFWSKGQREKFRKEARGMGLSVLEYKLLDRTIKEMEDDGLNMANIAALSRLIVSPEQYENLDAKFPFPPVVDDE